MEVSRRDRSLVVVNSPPSKGYFISAPGLSGGNSNSIAAGYRDKSVGARTRLYFSPQVIGNSSESLF